MVKVNLCVKEPQDFLNYKLTTFYVNEESANFHIQTLEEEVKRLPRKQLKKYQKIALSFVATLGTFMVFASKSMAATSPFPVSGQPTMGTTLPNVASTGIPPELMEIMTSVLVLMVAVSVVLCIGMLVAAGVLRALRKKKEATDWTVDIIKGLTQVILSAPIVFLIYYVSVKMFAGSGWFISPFSIGQ